MNKNKSFVDEKVLKTPTDHKLIINPLFFLVLICYIISRWVIGEIYAETD